MPLSLKYTFDAADPENESSDSIKCLNFRPLIDLYVKKLSCHHTMLYSAICFMLLARLSDHFDSINDRASTFYFSVIIQTDQKTVMHYDNGDVLKTKIDVTLSNSLQEYCLLRTVQMIVGFIGRSCYTVLLKSINVKML